MNARTNKNQIIVAKSAKETEYISIDSMLEVNAEEVAAVLDCDSTAKEGYETIALAVMAGKIDPALVTAAKATTEKGKRDNRPLAALLTGDDEEAIKVLMPSTSFKALRVCLEAAPATLRNAWGAYTANKKVVRRGALGVQSLQAAILSFHKGKAEPRKSLSAELKAWAEKNGGKAEQVLPETLYDILVEHGVLTAAE
jgi:hypothetical protein